MNLINAKYGHEPGLKAYTHVSDQFGLFATQTIPATMNEAPYILDGLLMNETGRKIQEHYADTGGCTDHVTALLGFKFIPRIWDLPSKRLYLFYTASCPKELKGLIGGEIWRLRLAFRRRRPQNRATPEHQARKRLGNLNVFAYCSCLPGLIRHFSKPRRGAVYARGSASLKRSDVDVTSSVF